MTIQSQTNQRQDPVKVAAVASDTLAMAELGSILKRVDLGQEASDIAVQCGTVGEAVDSLVAGRFLSEAATMVAHALPRREAVWWACVCADLTAPATLPQHDRRAAAAARSWVCRPRGETGRTAMRQAELAGLASPEAWAAFAAFWSESSTAPQEAGVPHPAYLTGVAVAGAIGLAARRETPERRDDRLLQFLASARDISLD